MMFEAVWQRLTLAQRAALRAVVLEEGRELLSADVRTRHRLGGSVDGPGRPGGAGARRSDRARRHALRGGRFADARMGRPPDLLAAGPMAPNPTISHGASLATAQAVTLVRAGAFALFMFGAASASAQDDNKFALGARVHHQDHRPGVIVGLRTRPVRAQSAVAFRRGQTGLGISLGTQLVCRRHRATDRRHHRPARRAPRAPDHGGLRLHLHPSPHHDQRRRPGWVRVQLDRSRRRRHRRV